MIKLAQLIDGQWLARDPPAVFCHEQTSGGGGRLRIAVPLAGQALLRQLAVALAPPLWLLYVLHMPRGEGQAGRYQSGPLSLAEVECFLDRFTTYLHADARFDFWIGSITGGDMLILDRHNEIYCYGELVALAQRLRRLGFREGPLPGLGAHQHNYHAAFDHDAAEILAALAWRRTPLHPEDWQ